MEYTRKNTGVCSKSTKVVIENGILQNAEILGGCDGNIKGVLALAKGMPADEVIKRVKDIKCGSKSTSCPQQLALAIEEALAQ